MSQKLYRIVRIEKASGERRIVVEADRPLIEKLVVYLRNGPDKELVDYNFEPVPQWRAKQLELKRILAKAKEKGIDLTNDSDEE